MSMALIVMVLSGGFIIGGVWLWQKGNHLTANGKTAKAVIFKNVYERSGSSGQGFYHPVVRFKTDQGEWVTQKLGIGYLPAKAEGTKLEVIYDPEDPTNVEIHSPFQLEVLPRLFVAFGLAGLIVGILAYLNYISF